MLKYILYPIFGVSVLGAYALSASVATDVGTTVTSRSKQLPPVAGSGSSGGYAAMPIIWYTGFHGPSRYVPSSSSSGGYGGSYGGYSGGK